MQFNIYTPLFPGGPINAMARCCSISEKSAYEILRESSSIENAIEKAIQRGKLPPSILGKLKLLYEYVRAHNIAIESETNSVNETLKEIETDIRIKKEKLIDKIFERLLSSAKANYYKQIGSPDEMIKNMRKK